jgi:hypothetical protein
LVPRNLCVKSKEVILLHLDKLQLVGQVLLALAQLALGIDKESLAYEHVLSTFQSCSLDERNDILKTLGVEAIGVRSKEEF